MRDAVTLGCPLLLLALCSLLRLGAEPPEGFVDLKAFIPSLVVEPRYFGEDNFVGRRIDGYEAPRCLLTREAAEALKEVQGALRPFGFGLKVFDAYRPQRAVDHFVRWAKDLDDRKMKTRYYPEVEKSQLFAKEYIAARSGHTRGSTVDVTIVVLPEPGAGEGEPTFEELDMGTGFDLFGPQSWPASKDPGITPAQRANRLLLQQVMTRHGFKPYAYEWWHFTLKDEPYPETYFDFPIR